MLLKNVVADKEENFFSCWRLRGNLKLFMSVLDKLGVKLDGDQLYEEYQKIYEETVSKNEMYEMEQEKQWNKGRGR